MSEGSESSTGTSGPGRLLESLWQDARREAGQELARARARADKFLDDIKAYREEEIAQAHERAVAAASSEVARILNRARSTVEAKVLQSRYNFISRCLEETRSTLKENPDTAKAVRRSFISLFREIAPQFESNEKLLVTISPEDLDDARAFALEAGLQCTFNQDPKTLGGVRIETADGSRVVDNTVASRLDTLGEELPVELMRLIDKEAGSS